MADDLDLPDDLRALERARGDARLQLDAYVTGVEIRRRAQYPHPEDIVARRTWTDTENERWHELRANYQQAVQRIAQHPVIAQAHADGTHGATETALRLAESMPVVFARRDEGREVIVVLRGGAEEVLAEDGQDQEEAAPTASINIG